jgi:ubiquinol-cytochrome c reductase cytochrome b subunit
MWPSIVFLPLSFVVLAVYPWLEARIVGDDVPHHLLQRPRDVPVRTALGVLVVTFYGCLQLAAAIDVLASEFGLSADALLWAGRVGVLTLPAVAYATTYRLCRGLQRDDLAVLEHGIETGVINRLPHGGYVEIRRPADRPGRHRAIVN